MNDLLDIEIILKRNRYSKIYNLGIIILGIMMIFIVLFSVYSWQTYINVDGQVIENEIKVLIKSDEVKYIINNEFLLIDKRKYRYSVTKIGDEVIYGSDGQNYQYVYLDVLNILKINNCIYQLSFFKEKKKLIKYFSNYL